MVVDTDVISFLFKGHTTGSLYRADLDGRALLISFMTLAELDRWAIQATWGEKRRDCLKLYLQPFVVMPYNRALCLAWAEVMSGAQARATGSSALTPGSRRQRCCTTSRS